MNYMDQNDPSDHEKQLQAARQYWDNAASFFDEEPDHGLRDVQVRQAWIELLKKWLPNRKAVILDAGCGTGSLSSLMAELGHAVTGIDLSPAMIDKAKAKAIAMGFSLDFQVMDAAVPQFPSRTFDAMVCRHLLWALPEPARVMERWSELLKPGGRLILIEGYWHTGGGLHAGQVVTALPASATLITVEALSSQPQLWGGPVSDERFAVIADRLPNHAGAQYL